MKAKFVCLVKLYITMVKMRPYKQFIGSRENIRELPLWTYCFTYSFTRQKKQIKEINDRSSKRNTFLEIGVPKQLTKS